jgi:8-oxo-dGTP pyrophosphatase MutT (NUDIX family)
MPSGFTNCPLSQAPLKIVSKTQVEDNGLIGKGIHFCSLIGYKNSMRHTARAVLINTDNHCFIAVHNHFIPENIGKWGTIGGIMDSTDSDILFCLRRELAEEFASASATDFEIGEKLTEIEKNGTTHHFFAVKTDLRTLAPSQPEEVLQVGFFPIEELKRLKNSGKLYFGIEDELFEKVLSKRVE